MPFLKCSPTLTDIQGMNKYYKTVSRKNPQFFLKIIPQNRTVIKKICINIKNQMAMSHFIHRFSNI